jgi:hypothetical protein
LERIPDSILGVALFGAECPEFFESFDRSFMTLFRIAGAQKMLMSLRKNSYQNGERVLLVNGHALVICVLQVGTLGTAISLGNSK